MSTRYAQVAWLLTGIPLVIGFVQGVGALINVRLGTMKGPIGSVAKAVHSLEIFRLAALQFYERSMLVVTLFVLVGITWVVLGITLSGRVRRHGDQVDQLRSGAAAFTGVLYGILFIGVYGGLLSADLATFQQLVFFATPIIVVGLTYTSVRLIPKAGPGVDIAKACQIGTEAKTEFRDLFHATVGSNTRSRLHELLPEEYHDRINQTESDSPQEEFLERCDTLVRRGERLEEQEDIDPETAASLRQRAEELDPEGAVESIDQALRETVAAYLEAEYGSVSLESRYGNTYDLVNVRHSLYMPDDVKESLPAGKEVHIESISPRLTDALRTGDLTAKQAVSVLDAVESGFRGPDGVFTTIEKRESEFADAFESIDATVNRAEERIDRFDPQVAAELRSVLLDGTESTPSQKEIDETVEEAKTELHTCQFETAMNKLESARAMASELNQSVEEIEIIDQRLDEGRERIRIPDVREFEYGYFSRDLLEALQPAFSQAYDVDIEIDMSTGLAVTYDTNSHGVEQNSIGTAEESTESSDATSPVVTEDAKEILNSVRDQLNAESASESQVEVNVTTIPDVFVNEAALECLRTFFSQHQGLVKEVYLSEDEANYISITAPEGQRIRTCVDEILETFETWAASRARSDRNSDVYS